MWSWLFLLVLAALALLLEQRSRRDPRQYLTVRFSLSARLAEPDEPFDLILEAENRQWLPVTYLELHQSFSAALLPVDEAFAKTHYSAYASGGTLRDTMYLGPRQRRSRRYALHCGVRGCYRLGTLHCAVGDFLGLKSTPFYSDSHGEVVILPRRSQRPTLPETLGGFLGDVSVRRFLLEDPVLVAGFADYTGREPQKAISWQQSARAGRIVVKKQDHTTEYTVAVVLDLEGAGPAVEECFSLTRSVCEILEEKRISWSFYTNANLYSSLGLWGELAAGVGHNHLYTVLEGLGRADGSCSGTFAALCEKLLRAQMHATGYLVIQPRPTPAHEALLQRLRTRTGCPVCTLYAQEEARP